MVRGSFCIAVVIAAGTSLASAGEVSGRILIERSVRKKAIAAVTYDLRGATTVKELRPNGPTNDFESVAVWLEPEQGNTPVTQPVTATIHQRDRHFDPELLIVPVGSTVEFPNNDPVFHNIFSLSRTQKFDLGYYPEGHSRSVKFQRAGIVQVYCHVHPKMYTAIVVTSSPWFTKPSANGAVAWKDLPPGKYRLMAWHRIAGLFRKDLAVPDNGSVSVTLSIPLDETENGR
jgi:plastocyanin